MFFTQSGWLRSAFGSVVWFLCDAVVLVRCGDCWVDVLIRFSLLRDDYDMLMVKVETMYARNLFQ